MWCGCLGLGGAEHAVWVAQSDLDVRFHVQSSFRPQIRTLTKIAPIRITPLPRLLYGCKRVIQVFLNWSCCRVSNGGDVRRAFKRARESSRFTRVAGVRPGPPRRVAFCTGFRSPGRWPLNSTYNRLVPLGRACDSGGCVWQSCPSRTKWAVGMSRAHPML